jgi:protein arginine kinase
MGGIYDAVAKIGLTIRGTYGEGSGCAASLYQVSNQITLGISETAAIENLMAIAERIVEREKNCREMAERLEIEDSVMRAYGILKNARILTSEEFMKLISRIKLGISLGIIDTEVTPISLLVEAGPAMLMRKYGSMTPRERDETRAKMIRELL